MSPTFRYARILNGFSFLISRRSAVSWRTREISLLRIARHGGPSIDSQTIRLDLVVEDAGPSLGEGSRDRVMRSRRSVTEQATAAARATNLRRSGPRRAGALDELVDHRCRDTRREALAVVPLDGDLAAHFVPVGTFERSAHSGRRIADSFEAVEDVPVAIDVALRDLPVVGSGVSRS